jgi:hypothetical protein
MPQSGGGMASAGGIFGGVGNVLGGLGGAIAASNDQRRMNDQLAKSLGMLSGYGAMNNKAFNQNVNATGFQGFNAARGAGENAYGNMLGQNQVMGIGGTPLRSYGFSGIADNAADRMMSQKAGGMYGFTNAGHQQGLHNLATDTALGNTNNLAEASTVPFNALMQQAAHSNDILGAMSSLFGTASTVGGMAMMMPSQQQQQGLPTQLQMNGLAQGLGPVNSGYPIGVPNFGITGYGGNTFNF